MPKLIRLTESDLTKLVKRVIREQQQGFKKPVIDFNKLPNGVDGRNEYHIRALRDAGFPDRDPLQNMNFARYYDRQVNSNTGQYYYSKKQQAPSPNYILSPQEKTQMGGSMATSGKYDKGFQGKFACVQTLSKSGASELDENKDGIVDLITVGGALGEKKYFPNGKLQIFRSGTKENNMKPHWENSTWYCSGNKVVDNFIQNKKQKSYQGNPFKKTGGQLYGGAYLPINTTDVGSNGKFVTNMQQKLIKGGYLKIPRPTGNYGRMTHQAIELFARDKGYTTMYDNGGLHKELYDNIVNS